MQTLARFSFTTSRIAAGSIIVAICVLLMKLLAWWVSGSVALFSDALESCVNVGAAVLAWLAVKYAQRPPDEDHPFGHHKAEYFAAVAEGVLIILAAVLIVEQAVETIFTGATGQMGMFAFVVSGAATVINFIWARVLLHSGNSFSSPAFSAGGRHLMSDVWTSIAVISGLCLVMLTGWGALDPIIALVVAVNILREGFHVVSDSIGGLMDSAASAEEQAQIQGIIHRSAEGALQIHGIKTRRAAAALFVEFHMVVDGKMTVEQSHDICDRIEEEIAGVLPGVNVTIHVEPETKLEDAGISPVL